MFESDKSDLTLAYKDLIKFYFEVKELIATAEREEEQQRISISAISELRSAFDHVARAHSVLCNVVTQEVIQKNTNFNADDYCRKNYSKAYAHLYRAGYDAYDCIAISLVDEIEQIMRGVSRQALHTIINDATSCVVNPYQEAKALFTSAKVLKDVENRDKEKNQFQTYETAVKQLYKIRQLLEQHEIALLDYDKEKKREIFKQRLFVVSVSLISLTMGYLISHYSTVVAAIFPALAF